MNILYFSPTNSVGGAELSLIDILKEANKHGYNCYVALPPPKRDDLIYMEMLKPYCKAISIVRPMRWHITDKQKCFIKMINYFYNCYLSGWHVIPVIKLLRIIRKYDIDIVHTNTIMDIDSAIAAKLKGIPHVWHIREGIGLNRKAYVRFPFQQFPKLFRWVMDRLTYKIIINSKYTASLAKQYFPNDKLEVIYNSLPDEWFVKKKTKHNTKSEFIIGIVANITAIGKNHSLAIEVADIINKKQLTLNIKFNFYGYLPTGKNPYYSGLKNKIKTLRLTDSVRFLGRKNPEEIYNTIDILFHPCDKEGFGRIFIEAMGKGIPVVAVHGGGADELIEDSRTGFKVSRDSPEDAVDKIIKLINNTSKYNQISQNSFEYSSTQFKSSEMWGKIRSCYDTVVS